MNQSSDSEHPKRENGPQIAQISQMQTWGRDPRTHEIIGAAMDVHRELGEGFLEAVYQEALAIELAERGVPLVREVGLKLEYKGKPLCCSYKADFVCFNSIIVELKALVTITSADQAQLMHYLKGTGFELGVLLNFGASSLQWKRVIFSQGHLRKSAQSAKSADKFSSGLPATDGLP